MSSYLYELPTTGAVSFSDFCYDQFASYVSEVAETTEARANLRTALKESKRTNNNEKDYLKLVKILDETYWRTTLSSSLLHNSPRISLPSLSAELAFTLLTYGFALSNLARVEVVSLGLYETERGISDTDRKAKDERLGFAVTLLCKASGVFEYIAKDVLAIWDKDRERAIAGGMNCPRAPDLSREILIGLSKTALADAQTLAIRKLLSRAAFESTITPGPPLPKSHPSPALAAKLHLECVSLYSSARALAKTPGASRPTLSLAPSRSRSGFGLGLGRDREREENSVREDSGEEVSPELRRYLADEIAFHTALSHMWLGVDAGENGGTSKGGIAVGFLVWAKKELEDMKNGGLGHGGVAGLGTTDREKTMREQRRSRVHLELNRVNEFLKGYKRMNDSMAFQTVPPQSDLQASIPAGRMAIAVRPFSRPTPEFGPGSAEYTRRQTEELDLLATQGDGVSGVDGVGGAAIDTTRHRGGTYAGEGSYF